MSKLYHIIILAAVLLGNLVQGPQAMAQAKKKAKQPTFNLQQALTQLNQAMLKADIDQAEDVLDQWLAALKKIKKPDMSLYEQYYSRLQQLQNMMERVEDLPFVGVSQSTLIQYAPNATSNGQHLDAQAFHYAFPDLPYGAQTTAHIPPMGREVFFSAPTPQGGMMAYKANILLDGSTSQPEPVFDKTIGADTLIITNPVLAPDGLTLYIASNIPGSLGALDIFRAVRANIASPFGAPVNIGMPYNSTGNDSYMTFDPQNGTATFISDRAFDNTGQVAAYTFIPNDTRRNLPEDNDDPTENLTDFQALESIINQNRATHKLPETTNGESINDYSETDEPDSDFTLYVPQLKRTLTRFSQVPAGAARNAVKKMVQTQTELDQAESQLFSLREAYAGTPARATGEKILALEQRIAQLENRLLEASNLAITLIANQSAK